MQDFDLRTFMTSVRRVAGERFLPKVNLAILLSLLRLQGEDFLNEAYQRLLGRSPDETGLRGYAAKSKNSLGRVLILTSLLFSPEQTWVPDWLRRTLACIRRARH